MPAVEAVGPARARQISDVGCLGVGQVLVGTGPVAGIESDEGRGAALALSRVSTGLKAIISMMIDLFK